MSISWTFNKLNGALLKFGARVNSSIICSFAMGRTHVFNNSEALRIAAERKNYDAFEAILRKASCEDGGFMTRLDFGLGDDWDKVAKIGESDDRIAKALIQYEHKSDENLEALLRSVEDLNAQGIVPKLRV